MNDLEIKIQEEIERRTSQGEDIQSILDEYHMEVSLAAGTRDYEKARIMWLEESKQIKR